MSWRIIGVCGYDAQNASSLSLAPGESLTLGRAHVHDTSKNVSRAHLRLEVTTDGLLYATALSINVPVLIRKGNPSFLTKDDRTALASGDEISLITGGEYTWKVELAKRSREFGQIDVPPQKRPRADVPAVKPDPSAASSNKTEVSSAFRVPEHLYIPLLGADGGLDRSTTVRIAEEELANYPLSLKVSIISNEEFHLSNNRIQIVRGMSEESGESGRALVLDVSWRWKPASLATRKYFSSAALQHCKNAFGVTAKPGEAYLVPSAVVSGLPSLIALIVVVTSVKSDGLADQEAVTQLRTLYKAILSRLTVRV